MTVSIGLGRVGSKFFSLLMGWVGFGQSANGLGWVGSHKMDPGTIMGHGLKCTEFHQVSDSRPYLYMTADISQMAVASISEYAK